MFMSMANTSSRLKDKCSTALTGRPLRLMADEEWGEYKKEDWVEEVGETKMAAVLIVQFPSCLEA